MLRLVAGLVVVALIAIVLLLVFGGDDPPLSPQDQSTPTSTPRTEFRLEPGTTVVHFNDDDLTVDPSTVDLQNGYLTLDMQNDGDSRLEIALVQGEEGWDAIVAMPMDPGARRTDKVGLEEAGTYTLLVREPGDDDSPGFARKTLRLR